MNTALPNPTDPPSHGGHEAAGDQPKPSPAEDMFAVMYEELRAIAARVLGKNQAIKSLNPTGLVHEAYIKLVGGRGFSEPHFLAIAAKTIRWILVDHARYRKTLKEGGQRLRVELSEELVPNSAPDLLELHEAMSALEQTPPNGSRLAHIVELKYFGGMSNKHIAQLLGLSESTVKQDWKFARAWLRAHISGEHDEPADRPGRE